jgi:hypothetical protein
MGVTQITLDHGSRGLCLPSRQCEQRTCGMIGAKQRDIGGVGEKVIVGAILPTGSREGVSQCLLRQSKHQR